MQQVESVNEIQKRWKREGRTFRIGEVMAEHTRQAREALRAREEAILIDATHPDASDHTREVAEQIRDHRAAGNYTTQG